MTLVGRPGFGSEIPTSYTGWLAVDTECTGLDFWQTACRPYYFSFCDSEGRVAWGRYAVNAYTRDVVPDLNVQAQVQRLLSSPGAKIFHNRSYDNRMLRLSGFSIAGEHLDTMIAQHVINPDELAYGLKILCKKYLGIGDDDERDVVEAVRKVRMRIMQAKKHRVGDYARWMPAQATVGNTDPVKADMWMATPGLLEEYAVRDAVRTATLWTAQEQKLDEDEADGGRMWEVLRMEQKLMGVIEGMENRGIRLDLPRTKQLQQFYANIIAEARLGMAEHGGAELNPKSPKQVCAHFFGVLGYKPRDFSVNEEGDPIPCIHCKAKVLDEAGEYIKEEQRTKKGKVIIRTRTESAGCEVCNFTGQNPTCNGEYLKSIVGRTETDIAEPLAYHMLRYDGAKHMLSSFLEPYMVLVHDGVLHPNYKQVGPTTGRLACERPNLMQVASDDTPRKASDVPYRTRECFIPRDGFVLYMPDYSQVEVWLFATLSKDRVMLDILLGRGAIRTDFHSAVCIMVFGHEFDSEHALADKSKDKATLSPERLANLNTFTRRRKQSKLYLFAVLYGGGIGQQAEVLQCSRAEAERFRAEYNARIPGVAKFMKRNVDLVRKQGFIMNAFGRRIPISKDRAYKATNYFMQSSNADMMKRAMIRVRALCETPKYLGKLYLLLTIHDELVVEVHKSIHNHRTMRDVVRAMQGDDHITVGCPMPFPVGMKVAAERWSSTQEINDVA